MAFCFISFPYHVSIIARVYTYVNTFIHIYTYLSKNTRLSRCLFPCLQGFTMCSGFYPEIQSPGCDIRQSYVLGELFVNR
nr:MAG TPA: hypothetical protein [Caudoviricetes sp.]